MDVLHRQHENIKRSVYSESGRQAVRSIVAVTYRLLFLMDVIDSGCVANKVEIVDGICWNAQIPHVGGHLCAVGQDGRGYSIVIT